MAHRPGHHLDSSSYSLRNPFARIEMLHNLLSDVLANRPLNFLANKRCNGFVIAQVKPENHIMQILIQIDMKTTVFFCQRLSENHYVAMVIVTPDLL